MIKIIYRNRFSYIELPSEKFNDWLNFNFINIPQYSSDCNFLKDSYKQNSGIKRLCARVIKYIKSKPSILNQEHLKEHHCNLFNYWIYEQLANEYDDKSTEPVFIFADFLHTLSRLQYYNNNTICKLDSRIATIQDRKEKKELYEYCIDYKTIFNKSQFSTDKCNNYCTYVKNKIQIYEKFQNLCTSHDRRNCPDFYEICKDKDPKLLLNKLKCKDEMEKEKQQLKGTPDSDLSGTTSNSFPGIQSVSDMGNVFLGVVVTSMTSGFLYKVNINLIKINK
ncbi:hypothetical protein PVMG_05998 [Plasmodium vivax Mauritania I]|uniref:Uncharacterized protein n=1 Tax=Plasmodium vivax Mauritania I TaxID=1035515 RepID=A0A0J9VR51_PLAVI|nr:hypothetical protein PVMG_05998 [Plasmodium vivax Mauritania I]